MSYDGNPVRTMGRWVLAEVGEMWRTLGEPDDDLKMVGKVKAGCWCK